MSSDGTFKKWRVCRLVFFVSVNEFVVGPVKKKEKRTCSGHTWFRDVERFVFCFQCQVLTSCRGVVCVFVWRCARWKRCCVDALNRQNNRPIRSFYYVLLIFFGRVQPSCVLLLFGEALPDFFSSLSFFVYFYGVRLSPHKKGLQGLFETRVVVFVARAG